MKSNRKGQALVEFVIILPVIIMLIFSFIDLGRIILENNRLENLTTTVINKYEETNNYEEVVKHLEKLGYDDVELSIKKETNVMTIKLKRDVDMITPGLNSVLGDPYSIVVERMVDYEE